MAIHDERRVGDAWGAIFHLKLFDFVPLPEQVQGLRVERLGTGSRVRFFAIDGVFPA